MCRRVLLANDAIEGGVELLPRLLVGQHPLHQGSDVQASRQVRRIGRPARIGGEERNAALRTLGDVAAFLEGPAALRAEEAKLAHVKSLSRRRTRSTPPNTRDELPGAVAQAGEISPAAHVLGSQAH